MKLEVKSKNTELEALKPVGFVEPHIQLFFFFFLFFSKNEVFHMQPNCMTSTVTQICSSVTRNMLTLARSSWKTLVSMVNLDGYQYLQANSQRSITVVHGHLPTQTETD